jgi:anti-sigma-K factor RskA
MNYDRAELLEPLAARYAVGAMTPRVRKRFERLRQVIPAAERAAQSWERKLASLSVSVPAVSPPRSVWQGIERRIGGSQTTATAPGWMTWLVPAVGFAFGIVATVGLVRLYPAAFVPQDRAVAQRDAIPASYVGLLTDGNGAPTVLASSTRYGRTMSIKFLKPFMPPAGKLMQLWALPKEGVPFRLGIVPAGEHGSFTMADTSERLLSNVSYLAVSLEDASANAGPSPSEFVLSGHCVKLW